MYLIFKQYYNLNEYVFAEQHILVIRISNILDIDFITLTLTFQVTDLHKISGNWNTPWPYKGVKIKACVKYQTSHEPNCN